MRSVSSRRAMAVRVGVGVVVERGARRDRRAMAGGQVVEDDDLVAGLDEGRRRDRADIAGPAGHQDPCHAANDTGCGACWVGIRCAGGWTARVVRHRGRGPDGPHKGPRVSYPCPAGDPTVRTSTTARRETEGWDHEQATAATRHRPRPHGHRVLRRGRVHAVQDAAGRQRAPGVQRGAERQAHLQRRRAAGRREGEHRRGHGDHGPPDQRLGLHGRQERAQPE